ncbi:quinon protein alcohol dehydrogenase-like superfamily [Mycena rebaudengoi]|nr:quinon protein alcohol dehydrogenase-like superfamily [Mycena rebaudengoi]
MSSLTPSSIAPPWGTWSLDAQFLADLNTWTAEHPAKNNLRTSLLAALAALLNFGVKVAQAKHEVQTFAQEAVEWITQIADAFQGVEGGVFVAKAWDSLQEMRKRLVFIWAFMDAIGDGFWKRLKHAAAVEHVISEFKKRLESTRVCFRTVSAIHLAQGQDLILDHLSKMRILVTALQQENTVNRDILLSQAEIQIQNQKRIVAELAAQREAQETAFAERAAHEELRTAAPFLVLSSSSVGRRHTSPTTNPNAFFPTVAKQLCHFDDAAVTAIAEAVEARPSVLLQMSNSQAEELFVKPITAICEHRPVVIVIDALDEWNTAYVREVKATEILLDAIHRLPNNAKVFISSRYDMVTHFSRFDPHTIDLDTSSSASLKDTKIADIVAGYGEEWAGWPSEDQLRVLYRHAAGNFMWAVTATTFIRGRIELDGTECQDEILDDLRLDGPQSLDALYSAILDRCIPAREPAWSAERFRSHRGGFVDMKNFFTTFQSVLSAGPEVITPQSVPQLHDSFVDFITSRCSERFRIDEDGSNKEIASRCTTLLNDLHFNISQIASIPLHQPLAYACQFWADHVTHTSSLAVQELFDKIESVLENKFLYWLEVMSVMGKVPVALAMLRKMATRRVIREASQFVVAFHYPISQSAPHIYISALPFWPEDSIIFQSFSRLFPSRLIPTSAVKRRFHPLLRFDMPEKVTCLSFSPDGLRIAAASSGGTVQIWDSRTAEPLSGMMPAHTGVITCAVFSPTTGKIVTGGASTLCIMDVDEGKITATWRVHKNKRPSMTTALVFSADGRYIVSGGKDSRVRVWDGETGTPVGKPLRGHSGHSICLAFSSDNVHFASCNNKEIVLWAVGTNKLRMRFPRPTREGTIWACDLEGHVVFGPLTCPALENGTINSILFDNNGRCMVSTSGKGTVIVWDPIAQDIIAGPLEGHDDIIDSLAFSPDGQYLVSAARDKIVRVWSTKERPNAGREVSQRNTKIHCLALSPDGIHGASGADDGIIRVWDYRDSGAKAARELFGHFTPVDSVAFSHDGTRLISCSRQDSAIRVWDLGTGELACEPFKVDGHPLAVGFVSGVLSETMVHFRYVTARSSSGTVTSGQRYNKQSDILSSTSVPLYNTSKLLPHSKSMDETGSVSSVGSLASPKLRKSVSKAKNHTITRRSTTYLCAEGATVVSCSDKLTIQVTGKGSSRVWPAQGVTSVAVAPDGKHLVWGAAEKMFIWNVSVPARLFHPLLGHRDEVTAVAFSPDGSRIASASLDRTIRIRAWSSLERGANLGNSPPTRLAFSPMPSHSFPFNDRLYGEGLNTAKRHSRCALDEHGWMKGEGDELLFWVPPENRAGLWFPDTLAIVGQHPTTVDLSRFVHGEYWIDCYEPRC